MKALFAVKAIMAMAVGTVCVLMAGCGAGSIPSLASGTVSASQNPLVAIYTLRESCPGQAMVEFGETTNYGRNTAWYPANGYQTTAIEVAGMKASTTYHMHAQVQCANGTLTTPDTTFTTGPLPSSLLLPGITVTRPNPSLSSTENPGIEMLTITYQGFPAFFTDRDGNVIWYYNVGTRMFPFAFKFLPNGNIVLCIAPGVDSSASVIREIDLAGNTIQQVDIPTLQEEMAAAGFDFVPVAFHHDLLPLANGHVLAIVNSTKNFTNLPGYPGTIQVLGDGIVDLDQNLNPVWAWNGFDWLDIKRHLLGLPDWTHSNALLYSPDDGNLLLSIRHQSWVIKIDYNNGTGAGDILWRLGYQGNFALTVNGV
ncbi:MAG: aryl-sulfate sulfotransferase, partial [Candidatus Sulfotelmatobacter sp.]